MEEYRNLAELVQSTMDADNLGIREFARRLGISHPTVSDILAGGEPSLKTLRALAKYKHVSLSLLLKNAHIDNDPVTDDEYTKEAAFLVSNLRDPSDKEDVTDYARMKLEKQEKGIKKSAGNRNRVP
jgi:transcriptional regulator with XRE-family HTH domain